MVERVLASHLHTVGIGLDEEQHHVTLGRVRRHDHRRGEVRRGHNGLRATQHPTVFTAVGGGRRLPQVDRVGFGQRRREHHFAGGDGREQMTALDLGAELGDRESGDERGVQRYGSDGFSDLLQQEAGLQETEAAAPDVLG